MKPNNQPIEQSNLDPDGNLEVHSIFPTIQGECIFAGTPAVFVRLAGCNLQCPGCDTDYTSHRQKMNVFEVMHIVAKLRSSTSDNRLRPLIVITGGEPFRQNILPFIRVCIRNGYIVQIETNGSLPMGFDPEVFRDDLSVVCSPKTPRIDVGVMNEASAFKYVVEAGHTCEEDGLPLSVLGKACRVARPLDHSKVWIQPMDSHDPERNRANVQHAVSLCMKFGYRLCLQTHKILDLP